MCVHLLLQHRPTEPLLHKHNVYDLLQPHGHLQDWVSVEQQLYLGRTRRDIYRPPQPDFHMSLRREPHVLRCV